MDALYVNDSGGSSRIAAAGDIGHARHRQDVTCATISCFGRDTGRHLPAGVDRSVAPSGTKSGEAAFRGDPVGDLDQMRALQLNGNLQQYRPQFRLLHARPDARVVEHLQ